MSTDPGVDELLVRHHLRDLGVGHAPPDPDDDWWTALHPGDDPDPDEADADPKAVPPTPGRFRRLSGRLPDWRKGETADLGDDTPEETGGAPAGPSDPDAGEPDAEPEPQWEDAAPPRRPTPRTAERSRRRRQANTAWNGLEPRGRWLVSTSAGAGIGWGFGLEQAMSGWIAGCAHDQGQTAGLLLGVGLVALGSLAAYRTRGWWPPLAWCCRIPLATAILALALYAPGATP